VVGGIPVAAFPFVIQREAVLINSCNAGVASTVFRAYRDAVRHVAKSAVPKTRLLEERSSPEMWSRYLSGQNGERERRDGELEPGQAWPGLQAGGEYSDDTMLSDK